MANIGFDLVFSQHCLSGLLGFCLGRWEGEWKKGRRKQAYTSDISVIVSTTKNPSNGFEFQRVTGRRASPMAFNECGVSRTENTRLLVGPLNQRGLSIRTGGEEAACLAILTKSIRKCCSEVWANLVD